MAASSAFHMKTLPRFVDLWLQLRLHDLNSNGLLEIEELGCEMSSSTADQVIGFARAWLLFGRKK